MFKNRDQVPAEEIERLVFGYTDDMSTRMKRSINYNRSKTIHRMRVSGFDIVYIHKTKSYVYWGANKQGQSRNPQQKQLFTLEKE